MSPEDVVSLKEFITNQICHLRKELTVRIESNKELTEQRFRLLERETEQARGLIAERMEKDNKSREELRGWNRDFMEKTQNFVDIKELKYFTERIEKLEQSKAMLEGKASQTSFFISLGLTLVALVIGIAALLR